MKKIISLVVTSILVTLSGYIVVNAFSNDNNDNIKQEKIVEKKQEKKNNYEYITTENDNIENVLKNEIKEITKINYVFEEKEEEPEIKIKNGFLEENENIYYYENNIPIIGTKEIEGNIYYFNENGIMQKNIIIDNCYYDEEGKLYTGFKEIESNIYYFTIDGYVKGLYEIDNKKYYFDENGHLIKNSFYDNYYLDEDGSIVTGSKKIGDKTYIFDEEGKLLNGFQVIDGKEYFLDENMNKLTGLQIIDDIRYYFDFETGELIKKDVKSIIDISSWQGGIDFEKLKESNLVDGVIVRIGYGTTLNDNPVLDNKFERNINELNRLNIPYGIYLFGYAQNEDAAILEANFVIENIKKYNLSLSYPIFYDAELEYFDGVKYTKTMYKKVINKFISLLNENGYDNVGVYSNLYMLSSGGLSSIQKKIPKWVAQYNTKCEYEGDYVGWQYTSNGNIPGIEGRVDMNIF